MGVETSSLQQTSGTGVVVELMSLVASKKLFVADKSKFLKQFWHTINK